MNYFKKKGCFVYPTTITGWAITCTAILIVLLCFFSFKACTSSLLELIKNQAFWTITVFIGWYIIANIYSKNKIN